MSRTVTAMFDSRSQAEAARERLTQSRIDADDVRIVDQTASGQSAAGSSGEESGDGQGLWSAIKSAFLPLEDSHTYEEGMRRGGYLLCARVDEDCADEAIRILDESDSVDLDERETSWRSEGWSPYQATGASSDFQQPPQQSDRTVAEERIPIVEEELRVGKREVERGGARVRSYVTETPVSEQVNETVEDKVRHTEVEIDEGVRDTAGRSAFGSFGGTARSGNEEERSQSEKFEGSDKSRY